MALNFTKNTYNPIHFDGIGDLMPVITVEKRLRLQRVSLETTEDANEAIEQMASFFGEKSEEVAKYIGENLSPAEMVRLQIYLISGEEGLKKVADVMDGGQNKEAKNV